MGEEENFPPFQVDTAEISELQSILLNIRKILPRLPLYVNPYLSSSMEVEEGMWSMLNREGRVKGFYFDISVNQELWNFYWQWYIFPSYFEVRTMWPHWSLRSQYWTITFFIGYFFVRLIILYSVNWISQHLFKGFYLFSSLGSEKRFNCR